MLNKTDMYMSQEIPRSIMKKGGGADVTGAGRIFSIFTEHILLKIMLKTEAILYNAGQYVMNKSGVLLDVNEK